MPPALGKVPAVKRCASILLIACFLSLGSGALEYLHDLQHAAEDARVDAIYKSAGLPAPEHHHDETNCPVHAQLHLQFALTAWTPVLICLGLFIAFLSLLQTRLISRLAPARIDCRGPPCSWLCL